MNEHQMSDKKIQPADPKATADAAQHDHDHDKTAEQRTAAAGDHLSYRSELGGGGSGVTGH